MTYPILLSLYYMPLSSSILNPYRNSELSREVALSPHVVTKLKLKERDDLFSISQLITSKPGHKVGSTTPTAQEALFLLWPVASE